MNILLIGSRGCGKTTVGRILAKVLDRPFTDLDDAALAMLGYSTVREAWAVLGEPVWRAAESDVLAEILQRDGRIIALGGGTPIIPAARAAIEEQRRLGRARVVYLRCLSESLARRLGRQNGGSGRSGGAGERPSLTGRPPADEIEEVLAEREPIYAALADHLVDVDERSPEDAAAAIVRALEED
jgi:shikimate kinase